MRTRSRSNTIHSLGDPNFNFDSLKRILGGENSKGDRFPAEGLRDPDISGVVGLLHADEIPLEFAQQPGIFYHGYNQP